MTCRLPTTAIVLCFFSCAASAGTWQIDSTSAAAGASVSIPITLAGDGETVVGELEVAFDDGRLTLPVASGHIPGASVNGSICIRTSSNRLKVISNLLASTPIPTRPSIICNIPFTVLNPSAPGKAPVSAINPQCLNNVTNVTPCTASSGSVLVTGSITQPPVRAESRKRLFVLLSAAPGAPSIAQVVGTNFASGAPRPLTGLNVESPIRAHALLPFRAKGDFLTYLQSYPNTARAKLERTVVIEYPLSSNLVNARTALEADQYVLAASNAVAPEAASPGDSLTTAKGGVLSKDAANQYHLGALNIPQLRTHAGGWSLLGFLDSGIRIEHPDLRSFSGPNSQSGTYLGGGYLPGFAFDFGSLPDFIDTNVDEADLVPNFPAGQVGCDPNGDGLMEPLSAGHGTHLAGVAAGNLLGPDGVEGVCAHCSFAVIKTTYHECDTNSVGGFQVYTQFGAVPTVPSFEALAANGVQVISMSFGLPVQPVNFFCTFNNNQNANDPLCLMLQFAKDNDVAISASAGNFRREVFFPGNDARVDSAGGLDEALNFWDESPGIPVNTTNCRYSPSEAECGSNYSQGTAGVPRQDFVTPARTVRASIYPGKNWNTDTGCGDSYGGGSPTDGVGVCTGTSMSAPQLAGLLGVLRSINPLVPAGDPENLSVNGLRNVMAATTDRALSSLGWDPRFGYGRPNAAEAAKRMLGSIRGWTAWNRVTPLFGLYSTGASDYAMVASPQAATTLVRYSAASYNATAGIAGHSINGYPSFPFESGTPAPAARARAYILSTEFSRQPSDPPLTALFLLDRTRNWPLGCTPFAPPCNVNNRDFILLTSEADLSFAVGASYRFLGRQGYVYSRCEAEPGCIPLGAEKLYLQCNTSEDDCAAFLERDRANFEAAGYVGLAPFSSNVVLGYAYPSIDSDGDGLVDGMEYVIGTNPFAADSDGDGLSDAIEYPQAGVPVSDPCSGPNITCLVPESMIFNDGFE